MGQPESVRLVFTVLFAGVTLTCVVRLLSARAGLPARHDDVSHAIMAAGMIVMVLSWTSLLPTSVWVLLFGGQAAYFAAILLRQQAGERTENWEHTHHFVGSLGMLYMVVVLGDAAMVSMSPLAVSFGLYFLVYGVWSGVRALQPVSVGNGVLGRPLLVHGCRALMGGGMAYLLLAS
jgi:Domain of unknown function (DUF5134)